MSLGEGRFVDKLKEALGEHKVIDDAAILNLYSRESSGVTAESKPLAVVFPETPGDLSLVLREAYKYNISVYPQGSASSLSGSAAPLYGGIVVSFERMNRILEVSVVDSYAIVEPGVRIDDLNVVLGERGYMFPVDPASSAVATIGGAINSGAGGMRGAKYGTMRDWVLGLTIVLPDERGTVMRIGCRTVKCRQGYDLVRLIVGSEGTLALVAEAILRITPLPENVVTVLAFYRSLEDLAETVVEIKGAGVQPYIMEFMDDKTVALALKYIKTDIEAGGHMLLVSLDVNEEAADRALDMLERIMGKNALRLYRARNPREADEKRLFEIRRSLFLTQALMAREFAGDKGMARMGDIAVPPSRLADAVAAIRGLEEKYGLPVLIGGHIGDGNLHPAICFDPTREDHRRIVEEWYLEVMSIALKLGGTVSAEHGIGSLKKKGLEMELEHLGADKALEIMRAIKRIFDPKGLLNPGKVF